MAKFKDRIRQLRLENGWLQKELAEKIGVKRTAITGYENGSREPDIEKLISLSNIFSCSVDFLLGKTDNKSSKYTVAIDKSKLNEINLDDLDKIKDLIKKLKQQNIG